MFRRKWFLIFVLAASTTSVAPRAGRTQDAPPPPWFDTTTAAPQPDSVSQSPAPDASQPRVSNRIVPRLWASQPLPDQPKRFPRDASLSPPGMTFQANGFPGMQASMPVEPMPPSTPPLTEFQPSQIIAWVGDQPIQAGDVMPMIEQALAPELSKLDPEMLEAQKEEIEKRKQEFMKQALDGLIEIKLLYLDFLRSVPEDKRKEVLPKVQSRAEEQFYETQLPESLKKAKVETAAELDAVLRRYGSSLEDQKRTYIERMLGRSMIGQNINREPEITHREMLDYYHQNLAKFEYSAQARWEKLTVKFDQFPTKAEAWAALGDMGNQVLRGAPFDAVARRFSQGVDAADGGYHDWTTKGSLASETLDTAIFSLPAGQLSERLEDKEGFHILRVVERRDAGCTSFREAQVEIKETLQEKRMRADITKYVAKLRTQIRVWTIFDEASQSNGS